MKMKSSFLLQLLLSLVSLSLQVLIDWRPLEYGPAISTDPHLRSLTNATVNWYNKQKNTSIVLLNVTSGFVQVVGYQGIGEFHYVLNMDVLLEPKPKCHSIPPSHYQGVVFEMPHGGLYFVYFGNPTWFVKNYHVEDVPFCFFMNTTVFS